MNSLKRFTIAAAGLGLLTALSFATPTNMGTLGSEFTVTFDQDVGTKPKLVLSYVQPTKKAKTPKAAPKLVNSDGTNVTFQIKAAKGGGDFDVRVKGSDASGGRITLAAPVVAGTSSPTVDAGAELTINGEFFGATGKKKLGPKVFVGGKKAKVVSHTNNSVTVKLSKKTPVGDADIRIQTKVGETTSTAAVFVTTPPKPIKGADTFSAKVGKDNVKVKFTKKTPEAVVTLFGGVIRTLQITAVKNAVSRKSQRTQNLNILFDTGVTDLKDLQLPAVFTNIGLVTYSDNQTKFGGGFPPTPTVKSLLWDNDGGATPFTVTITNIAGDRISGTFSGSLKLKAGDGPGTVDVSGGKWTGTVEQ